MQQPWLKGGCYSYIQNDARAAETQSEKEQTQPQLRTRGQSAFRQVCTSHTVALGAALSISFLLHKMAFLIGRRLKHGQAIGKEGKYCCCADVSLVGSVALAIFSHASLKCCHKP